MLDLPGRAGEALADETGARFAPGDVRDEDAVAAAVAAARERGPLRVAVCCAGILSGARVLGRAGPHPLADFARVVEVNLIGTFNVLRLAAAAMAEAPPDAEGERGVIVTTASIAAWEGQIGQVAYAAAKAGVAGMTLPAARDLAGHGIRVVGIAPGVMETPMTAALPAASLEALGAGVPHPPRLGRPDEFADLVAHAIGNRYLNGAVIRLDGALRLAPR